MFEIFPWNAQLETGIDVVDTQHRRLVALINRLAQQHVQGASEAAVGAVLDELADYAHYHFQTEEAIWAEAFSGDAQLAAHLQSHQAFFDEVTRLRSSQQPFQQVLDTLFSYLVQWLAFHILDKDRRMALALQAVRQGHPPAQAHQLAQEHMQGATAALIQTVLDMYQTLSEQAIEMMREKIERQRAEAALQASEARWQALLGTRGVPYQWSLAEQRMHAVLDNVPVGLVAADMDSHRFVFANEVFCRMIGVERSQIARLDPLQIHPAQSHPLIKADFDSVQAGNAPAPMTLPTLHSDGSQFIADIKRIPLELDGRACLLGIFTDITDRVRAEQALAASESQLRALFNTLPDLLWLKDTGGVYLSCNAAFERFFGAPEAAIVGKTDYDFVPKDLADFFRDNDRAAMLAQKPMVNQEWITFANDGHRELMETTKVPILTADGRVAGVLGIAHDITERQRMQDELAAHHARLQTQVLQRTAALAAANETLRLKDERLNAMWQLSQQPDLTEPELIRQAVDLALRLTHSARGQARLLQGQPTGPSCFPDAQPGMATRCCVIEEAGQAVLELCVTGIPTPFEAQASAELEHIAKDLWALIRRQRTEQALAQAKEAAEAANRAKSAFLSNMSHEIRTPLNAIIGFAQVLARDPALNPRQQGEVGTIERSGQHLLTLINDVLDLSKIEAGRMSLSLTDFDLHAVVDDLLLMFTPRASAKGLALRLQRDPNVPRGVHADESKLRQVIINLLGNAIKFTLHGEVLLRLSASAATATDTQADLRLQVSVQDSGPGISLADQARLFNPFQQTAAGQRAGGTGLGLSICKRLVGLMGGELTLRSTPGQGSTFTAELPLQSATRPLESAKDWGHVLCLEPGTPPVRLLVVDDLADNRSLLTKLLEPIGFSVAEADNGQQALELLQQSLQPGPAFQAVLMDMRMPVMDGFEATRRIRADPALAHLPVIAVTASAFDEDALAVMACGVDAYVRKPIHPDELLHALGERLGLHYRTAAQPSALPALQPDDLASVPTALRHVLCQALGAGDMAQVSQALASLQQQQAFAPQASQLQQLADDFEIEQLQRLLGCC